MPKSKSVQLKIAGVQPYFDNPECGRCDTSFPTIGPTPYAAFLDRSFKSPNRTKLSAVATIASSRDRGVHPKTR